LKEAEALTALLVSQGKEVQYYLVGRKAVANFNFRKRAYVRSWIGGTDLPQVDTAREIGEELTAAFLRGFEDGGLDEIYLVGNRFVSMMIQQPEKIRLLPLEVVEQEAVSSSEVFPLFEFEPEVGDVLDALLPVYIENRIYNVMLQSAASEHAARQKAMKSATDNADKLIQNYTRLANAARQAEITQQISEIVGGADALATVTED
jgi:F-type H+-transporting ATPase subunit gamma